MPTARSEMPAVEIDGVVYAPGGFSGLLGSNRLEAYEIAEDRWHQLADMPQPRHHLMATAHQGALYVLGGSGPIGFSPTDSAWRYDPGQDRWTELPRLPEERMSGAAVSLDGAIYVVGGSGGSQDLLVYDLATQRWSRRAGPTQPSEHTAAVAYVGELWLIGGRWSGVGELTRVEIYDPVADRWRAGPPLQTARGGFAAATDGMRILVAGGEVIMNGNLTLASVELYHPESGDWMEGVDLPFPVHGVDAIEYAGRFLVMGGSDRAGGIDNHGRVQIYAP